MKNCVLGRDNSVANLWLSLNFFLKREEHKHKETWLRSFSGISLSARHCQTSSAKKKGEESSARRSREFHREYLPLFFPFSSYTVFNLCGRVVRWQTRKLKKHSRGFKPTHSLTTARLQASVSPFLFLPHTPSLSLPSSLSIFYFPILPDARMLGIQKPWLFLSKSKLCRRSLILGRHPAQSSFQNAS